MLMNGLHRWYCRSDHWRRATHGAMLPWALQELDLGDAILEVGPGPGVTTDWLRQRANSLECLEKDPVLAGTLRTRLAGTNVSVRCGDATAMPYEDCRFTGLVAFTMLHHIPTAALQDKFFSEALRVLKPGGILAGVDSLPSLLMCIFHVGDTMVLVDPETLPDRLRSAGFTAVRVEPGAGRFRFSAKRPAESGH